MHTCIDDFIFLSESMYELLSPAFWNCMIMCLCLSWSIVPGIHLYPLNLEARILHLCDLFSYFFFFFTTSLLLLSSGPPIQILDFLFGPLIFLSSLSYFSSFCFPLSEWFLHPYNLSIHFFISVIFLISKKIFLLFTCSILFVFMHAVIEYFFSCISQKIFILMVACLFLFLHSLFSLSWFLSLLFLPSDLGFSQMFVNPWPFTHERGGHQRVIGRSVHVNGICWLGFTVGLSFFHSPWC